MTSIFDHKANFSGEEKVPLTRRTRERVSSTPLPRTFSDSTHQFSATPISGKNRYQRDYVGIYPGSDEPGEYLISKQPLSYQTEYQDENAQFLSTGKRDRPSRPSDRVPRSFELATQRIQRLNVFPDGTPRSGAVADVNLEKIRAERELQSEEDRRQFAQFIADLRNLPANIAALAPKPELKGLFGKDVKSVEANAAEVSIRSARERLEELEQLKNTVMTPNTFRSRAEEIARKMGATLDLTKSKEDIERQLEAEIINSEAVNIKNKNQAIREAEMKEPGWRPNVDDDRDNYAESHRKKRTIVGEIDETVRLAGVPTISDLTNPPDIGYADTNLQNLLRLHNSVEDVSRIHKNNKKTIYSLYRDRVELPIPASIEPKEAREIAAEEAYHDLKQRGITMGDAPALRDIVRTIRTDIPESDVLLLSVNDMEDALDAVIAPRAPPGGPLPSPKAGTFGEDEFKVLDRDIDNIDASTFRTVIEDVQEILQQLSYNDIATLLQNPDGIKAIKEQLQRKSTGGAIDNTVLEAILYPGVPSDEFKKVDDFFQVIKAPLANPSKPEYRAKINELVDMLADPDIINELSDSETKRTLDALYATFQQPRSKRGASQMNWHRADFLLRNRLSGRSLHSADAESIKKSLAAPLTADLKKVNETKKVKEYITTPSRRQKLRPIV